MKNFFCAAALALGAIAMTATSMYAHGYEATVSIPFSFRVVHTVMPAGEYKLEQPFGSELATLINLQTGERVRILRSNSVRTQGKLKLVFQSDAKGHTLKSVQ